MILRISKIGHKTCAMHVLQILRNIVFSPIPRSFPVLSVLTLTFNCKGNILKDQKILIGGRDAACSYSHNIFAVYAIVSNVLSKIIGDTEIGMCFYMP